MMRALPVPSLRSAGVPLARAGDDARPTDAPRTVRVSNVGILTWATEDLVIVPEPPTVGRAVCLVSGGRYAFRRVLEVCESELRLRGDVAPFEDRWRGEIVGCVRPRFVDVVAAIDPELWTRTNWRAAVGMAHALAARRRMAPRRRVPFTSRLLDASEWPRVRRFWREACGNELHVESHGQQHVVGLFDGDRLVGANIHLVFGKASYSAYTLVDRRYRGTGGGIALIRSALRVAREQKLESIYVHINARNLPSIRAYQRAGFERRGWWSDASDPLASAERQWLVFENDLTTNDAPSFDAKGDAT